MGGASKHQDFFTSSAVKALYKQHISYMIGRTNSINGRKYSEDTAIMAWNLANEARCQNCGSAPMQSWIGEMCAHVKSVAPNQLVGIGYEGFYGPESGRTTLNPADWAAKARGGAGSVGRASLPGTVLMPPARLRCAGGPELCGQRPGPVHRLCAPVCASCALLPG